jgi:hypothetical protein
MEKEIDLSEVPDSCINCTFFEEKVGCTREGECPNEMPFKPIIKRPKRFSDN